MKNWKVRAEIKGEFVTVETFKTMSEAIRYAEERKLEGIYDSIEMWEI